MYSLFFYSFEDAAMNDMCLTPGLIGSCSYKVKKERKRKKKKSPMIMKTSLVGVGLLLLLVAMIQKSHAQSETLDTLKLYASFKRLDEIKPEIVDRLMKTKDKRHSAAPPLPLHPPPTSLGEDATPIDYVDTRIGTGGYFYDVGALGPGPQVPFGAARLGPDTSFGLERRWLHKE